jgi:hypothetical protein
MFCKYAGAIPEDNDFRFVDWTPDASRAPCCGYHCQTCPGGLIGEKEVDGAEEVDDYEELDDYEVKDDDKEVDGAGNPYYCANQSPVRISLDTSEDPCCNIIERNFGYDTLTSAFALCLCTCETFLLLGDEHKKAWLKSCHQIASARNLL